MGEMRSAFEIAMEKAEQLEKPSAEELERWRCVPEGERLAVRYLEEDCDLIAELNRYGEGAREHVIEGVEEVLLRNIELPGSDLVRRGKSDRKVVEGLKLLKRDKVAVENVFSKVRRIFNHYQGEGAGQRKQAYESLKADFQVRVQQAIQQQLGTSMGIKIDVERQPQFQEEWRRVLSRLDSQYQKLLDEYKGELQEIR